MDGATRTLIESIHQASSRCVLVVTGGGAGAAGVLFGVPGASRSILEFRVPYHEQALTEFLGHAPAQFCSEATSQLMAERAFERGCWLVPGERIVGLGCTASLATDRPKRGAHRLHLSVRTPGHINTCSLLLSKGARDRAGEEAVVQSVLLNALAEGVDVTARLVPALRADETLQVERKPLPDPLSELFRGERTAVLIEEDGRIRVAAERPALLLPGAFNPIHAGHWFLAAAASRRFGQAVAYELSVINVDKPPLSQTEVRHRLHQFLGRARVWVTRAPTFVEKANIFPGTVFVVGADTAARIVAPRYYQDGDAGVQTALDSMRSQGCRFLVAARENPSGQLQGLEELCLPSGYLDLFTGIPKSEFHVRLSSTGLRMQTRRSSDGPSTVDPGYSAW